MSTSLVSYIGVEARRIKLQGARMGLYVRKVGCVYCPLSYIGVGVRSDCIGGRQDGLLCGQSVSMLRLCHQSSSDRITNGSSGSSVSSNERVVLCLLHYVSSIKVVVIGLAIVVYIGKTVFICQTSWW